FMEKAEAKAVQFHIQTAAVIADEFNADANTDVVAADELKSGWMCLDIGPGTAAAYRDIALQAQQVIGTGPMGVFEMPAFSEGTKAVTQALADTEGYTIIGGGDSAAAVEQFEMAAKMDHISTGGGASLEFMEGKVLPGIEALDDK